MRWLFVLFVLLHGMLHLLGFVKAFGLAELSALTQPISRPLGVVWLIAAVLLAATAAALAFSPRTFWLLGLPAVVVSQAVIVPSWSDARAGTIANLIIALVVAWVFFAEGPMGLRAEYRRSVREALADASPGAIVEASDLAALPPPVARYLEVSGALGRPRANAFRAHWKGRITGRAHANARAGGWMPLEAEQVNTLSPVRRYFFMDARMFGLPVLGLHAYAGHEASMRVRLLGLFSVADARGPEMTRAETVTVFNDLAVLAPSMLLSPAIRWEPLDADRARGFFTNAGHTVSAEFRFGSDGMLVDFVSDDRARSVDGKALEHARWSTPLSAPQAYGPLRLSSRGEARWHEADGSSYAYIELSLLDVEHDPTV